MISRTSTTTTVTRPETGSADRHLEHPYNQVNFRKEDSSCRIGGDEFVVLMPHRGKDLRDTIITAVDGVNHDLSQVEDGMPPITVSAGIADGRKASDSVTLFELADRAMYECKRSGKHGYRFSSTSGEKL